MQEMNLLYGKTGYPVARDPDRLTVIGKTDQRNPISDAHLGKNLEEPVGSRPIEEIAEPGETVLIAVPDATRRSGAHQVVNLLVRRLIASGTLPHDIAVIFATGIHRAVTAAEKDAIVTPFVTQRIRCLDHSPRDLAAIARVGETRGGIPVELNRALLEFDRTITVGAVNYHYFAGFTGGRKLACPGLASSRTIAGTHRLAFDFERLERARGVAPGELDGNPVHEAFIEAVSFAPPAFAVNTMVDDRGAVVDAVCGDWQRSHLAACERFAEDHSVPILEKRPFVAVSCGGAPYDVNMIQAHKALESAARACEEGGTIVLFAECAEGTGRADFLEWFRSGSSNALAQRLAESYQVNGQTAWSLLEKTERYDIRIVTELPEEQVSMMGMRKTSPSEALEMISEARSGYVLPFGAKFLPIPE